MHSASAAELELIAQDCFELSQLVLNKNKDEGVVGLGVSPFVALFAEESFSYLSRTGFLTSQGPVPSHVFDEFSNTVTKLRARTKLFDDTRGGLIELIETLALAGRMSSEYFLSAHQGLLGSLRRRLQPDLGIFYAGEHLVCTTHTAIPTMGFTRQRLLEMKVLTDDNMRDATRSFTVSAGRYIGGLHAYLSAFGYRGTPRPPPADHQTPFTHNDHFSHRVYKHVSEALDLTRDDFAVVVIFLLAQVNFVERVLSELLAADSLFLLRIRFLTAYHATNALKSIVKDSGFGSGRLSDIASSLLKTSEADFLLGSRPLRNALAHYGLRDAGKFVDPNKFCFDDVVVRLCGCPIAEVHSTARRQSTLISEALVEVISKSALRSTRAALGSHT